MPERYVRVDLDKFLPAVYVLWRHGGLLGVFATAALHTVTMTSVAVLCYILVECVDYSHLFTDADLLDAVSMRPPSSFLGWLFLLVMVAVLVPLVWHSCHKAYCLVHTHRTLAEILGPDWTIQHFTWGAITKVLADNLDVTQVSIAQRLTRHQAYLRAMVQAHMFTLRTGRYEVPCMTHVLQWVVRRVVFFVVPGSSPLTPNTFHEDLVPYFAATIRKRCLVVMVFSTLAMPVLLLFMAVYYVIRYGQLLRLSPTFLLSRHWSVHALWHTAKPLELKHQVLERLAAARKSMELYSLTPPTAVCQLALQAAMFYASLVCVTLLAVMMVRDDFTDVTLAGNSLLWWVAIGAGVYTAARSALSEPPPSLDRETALEDVARHLDANESFVRSHWPCLYEYRVVGFMKEVFTLAALPLVVYAALYRQANTLTRFVLNNTAHVEGVGNIHRDSIAA